jgi:hypothetical protein
VHNLDGDPAALGFVSEPVRLYRPRDHGTALLDVVILSGALAGRRGRVRRDRVFDDKNGYVKTEQELTALAAAIAAEGFYDNGILRPLPYQEGRKYCWARAHEMTQLLKASGYRVDKLLLIDDGFLIADSIFGDDLTPSHPSTAFYWTWHVAPVVYTDARQMSVIDPSLLPTAQPWEQWAGRMNVQSVLPMDYQTMVDQLEISARFPKSPKDSPWLVTAGDNVLQPPSLTNPTQVVDAAEEQPGIILDALGQAADVVPRRLAIGALNTLRNTWLATRRADGTPYPDYPVDLGRATTSLQRLSATERDWVVRKYPNLRDAIRQTFAGTGVEGDIAALLTILNNQVGVQ